MTERRYVPGESFTVVTEQMIALLGPQTLPEIVEQVWQATLEGVSLDVLLEVLTSGHATALPAFALVGFAEDEVRAFLHGEVTFEVFGADVGGPDSAASSEARFRSKDAEGLVFSGLGEVRDPVLPARGHTTIHLWTTPAGVSGPWLPVVSGVVLGSALSVSFTGSEGAPGDFEELESGHERPDPAHGAQAIDFDEELHGHTILKTTMDADSGDFDEELDGHTILGPSAVANLRAAATHRETCQPTPPVPPPPPEPEESATPLPTRSGWAPPPLLRTSPVQASSRIESEADHDGLTVMSSDLVEIRSQLATWKQDSVPGPFQVPQQGASSKLILSTGDVVALDRTILIGRAPVVSRVSNRDLPRVVTVESPNQDISRTHVEVRSEGHRVFVTDLNSTNGVTIAPYGQDPKRIRPGVPTVLGVDASADIGDGVTFKAVRH